MTSTFERMRAAVVEYVAQRHPVARDGRVNIWHEALLVVVAEELDARSSGVLTAGETVQVALDFSAPAQLVERLNVATRKVRRCFARLTPEQQAEAAALFERGSAVAARVSPEASPKRLLMNVRVVAPSQDGSPLILSAVVDPELAAVVGEIEAFAVGVDTGRPS